MRERAAKKKCIFFRICLNGNDYHFKTSRSSNRSIYANSMVSTNQNSTLDTQKLERKEHKYTTKNSSNHKGNNKMKEKKNQQRWSAKTTGKQVIKW